MKLPRIAAVYTACGIIEPCANVFTDLNPEVELVNIADDKLIFDINRLGGITPAIDRRTMHYFRAAGTAGVDAILCTCSSIGEVADRARESLDVPIFKIDEPMIRDAAQRGGRIGVLATLRSTLDPTVRFIRKIARELGTQVEIVRGLSEGTFEIGCAGDMQRHDERIIDTAQKIAEDVDFYVLAQASMARVEPVIHERTGKQALSSLRSGIETVVRFLEEGETND